MIPDSYLDHLPHLCLTLSVSHLCLRARGAPLRGLKEVVLIEHALRSFSKRSLFSVKPTNKSFCLSEIPLFHVLNARITFGNVNGCSTAEESQRGEGTQADAGRTGRRGINNHVLNTKHSEMRKICVSEEESLD